MLSRHDVTVAEVLQQLSQKGFSRAEAAAAVETLSRSGLLSDERFARNHVELRLAHRPCGRALLLAELTGHGVNEALALSVLGEMYPESDEAMYAAKALAAHFPGKVPDRRAVAFLARRGFAPSVLERYIEAVVGS